MEIFNLGQVRWEDSQLIYHALAKLGREALALVSPATPYVCIGYHQDAEQEVDLAFCRENAIPVFRREVGGGAVYLDGRQLFFQLILKRDNPAVPANRQAFYRKFLKAPVEVYRRIGIAAEYKPVNDIICEGRKISGTGVGEIGECIAFVGNLILDFDYAAMSRVLRVPDAKFRDKLYKTLYDNLTTIRRELDADAAARWDEASLNAMLEEAFGAILGPMQPGRRDGALERKIAELAERMNTDGWLLQKGRRFAGRQITIRSGVRMIDKIHKAAGGLIRAELQVLDERYVDLYLSGDFFCFPPEAIRTLEGRLRGKTIREAAQVIEACYAEQVLDTPGIGPEDWLQVLVP